MGGGFERKPGAGSLVHGLQTGGAPLATPGKRTLVESIGGGAARLAPTGEAVKQLDQEGLERRAQMLAALPLVTKRWKDLGGPLFTPVDDPVAPIAPEVFAEQAFGLILETTVDLSTVEPALVGPGREKYALAFQRAAETARSDRPIVEKLQKDVEYLTSGGDLQFAATRIVSNHAL